jgi:hypothetical protein
MGFTVIRKAQEPVDSSSPATSSSSNSLLDTGIGALKKTVGIGKAGLEGLLDAPGHIANLAASVAEVPGNLIQKGYEKLGIQDYVPSARVDLPRIPEVSKYTVSPAIDWIFGKGRFNPEGPIEESLQSVARTFGGLAVPGLGVSKGTAALLSGGGELAKFGAKKIGLGKDAADAIGLGAMMALSFAGKPGARSAMKKLYNEAEELAPATDMVSMESIQPILKDLKTKIARGKGEASSTKKLIADNIRSFESKVLEGKIGIQELIAFKQDFNTDILENPELKGLNKYIPTLSNSVKKLIEEYSAGNKAFASKWNEAENMFMGLHKASPVNEFLQKHASPTKIGYITAAMLAGGKPFASAAKHIAQASAIKGLVRGTEALYNSSAIRKYYANVVASAARENAAELAKNINKLDKQVTKEFPDNSIQPGSRMDTPKRYIIIRK